MERYTRGDGMTMPLRVAYVGSPELYSRGASAIHIMKMCQAMGRLGAATDLLIPCYGNQAEMYSYYGIESGFSIKRFPYFDNSSARNILHGILSAFYMWPRKGRYDLTVTRNIVYAFLAVRLFGMPTVYDAHHPLVKGARPLFGFIKDSPHLVRFSTNSGGLAEIYLKEGLPPGKLVVAPNGVDLAPYLSLPDMKKARADLGLPADKKIVCYSGNIYEGRGIELLIDVSLRMPGVKFLIVGGREEDVQVYRRLAEVKKAAGVKLTSYVHHNLVPLYLAASDVLVMPYTSGMTIKGGTMAQDFTSPIKLFEYMASKRPIVATALPSVSEMLRDGVNALLVRPDSADELYAGIERVLGDKALAERIAGRAFEDVKGYTWEERAKKLLGLN